MSRAHRRGPWVTEEDATLLSLVASRGPNNWVQISQHMHFRSPKQCRERYHQNLKSSLNHDPISPDEGELIEQMVTDMGKKWAEIARRLGNRSDNAVKNWWNGSQNRRRRNVSHQGQPSKTLSNRQQPLSAVRPPRPSIQQDGRYRNHAAGFERCHRSWQHRGPPYLDQDTFRSPPGQVVRRASSQEPSLSHFHEILRYEDKSCQSQQALEHHSPPILCRSSPTSHPGPLLPTLGPINTSHALQSSISHAMQPPHSATSLERAPSLVSDRNSTYSISPKTWPSPRPELPAPLDTSRSHWNESANTERRGSAPAISDLLFTRFTGDEGYVSAIPPSASSDHTYPLPTPMGRPGSLEAHYSNLHRHSSSNPSISLSPMIERYGQQKDSSSVRDTRMNFSSLLN